MKKIFEIEWEVGMNLSARDIQLMLTRAKPIEADMNFKVTEFSAEPEQKRGERMEKIPVSVNTLKYFATFQCEHSPAKKCYEANRGGLCNSCWVKTWAEEQLSKIKELPAEPKPKSDVPGDLKDFKWSHNAEILKDIHLQQARIADKINEILAHLRRSKK